MFPRKPGAGQVPHEHLATIWTVRADPPPQRAAVGEAELGGDAILGARAGRLNPSVHAGGNGQTGISRRIQKST